MRPATPNSPPEGAYLTLQDAADYLQVSTASIRRYVKQGALKAFRVGKFLCFTKEQLNDFVKGGASPVEN